MKTRQGFVSNSSSSSFLIYGIALRESDLKKITTTNEELKKAIESVYDLYEIGEIACEGSLLDYHSPEHSNTAYIGKSWDMINDDETGAQFKERVQKEIDAIFGEGFKCSTYEDAWHDS